MVNSRKEKVKGIGTLALSIGDRDLAIKSDLEIGEILAVAIDLRKLLQRIQVFSDQTFKV